MSGSPPTAAQVLIVCPLTDSFETIWPTLAAECGLPLRIVTDPAEIDASVGGEPLVIVSSGGAEEKLEAIVRAAPRRGGDLAAVGALADHRLATALVRGGAAEYFALPEDHDRLQSWLRDRVQRFQQRIDRNTFASREAAKYRFDGILGESDALRAALERAARVIPHPGVTVLITGETGTGKELLARAIHYNGPRRNAPFVEVNCAAIPAQLLESELFGHEKGAFTDASTAKPGLFEVANGGTIFLDEIGHLALQLQGKLLRALEERVIRRVGGTRSMAVDIRVMAATNVDLASASARGEFREDLYFRLNVLPIEMPPLRARRGDILPLARHFLATFAKEYGLDAPALSPEAERTLQERPWPGNVRELRNVMERATLLATGDGAPLRAADVVPDTAGVLAPVNGISFPAPLGDVIHSATLATLALCSGNKSEAARRLGITRARLQRILDKSPDDSEATDA